MKNVPILPGSLLALLVLSACAGETSMPTAAPTPMDTHIPAPTDVLAPNEGSWHYIGETPPPEEAVPVPQAYKGNTYEQTLEQVSEEVLEDPYYYLVWGDEGAQRSTDGAYAVYTANKDDLTRPELDMMLLDLETGEERVLFRSGSRTLYVRGWVDSNRFLYEQDNKYYLCDLRAPEERTTLTLEGDAPYIFAQDGAVLVYGTYAPESAERIVARITQHGAAERLAVFDPGELLLMAECTVSAQRATAVFKVRVSKDSGERYILLFDYANDTHTAVEPPAPEGAQAAHIIHFSWREDSLLTWCNVQYPGEERSEVWEYTLD